MYSFGNKSQERLNSCHKDIQLIMNEVIKIYDVSVLEGLRTDEQQLEYFEQGKSKLDGIKLKSKHQDRGDGISYAIDIMPYKKGTNPFSGSSDDLKRFYFMAGIVFAVTKSLLSQGLISHSIRWGGDWKMDMIYKADSEFTDLPHFELMAV